MTLNTSQSNAIENEISSYRKYHQTLGNRITHFIGIPLILCAIFCALGWFRFSPFDIPLSAATVFWVGMIGLYFRIHKSVALGFACWSFPLFLIAEEISVRPFGFSALFTGSAFIIGWMFQFWGHAIEKNKPAFFTQWNHLWRGPLFITYEWMSALGITI